MTRIPAGGQRQSARRRGWTLVQLLIVVSIVSILSALFIGVFGNSRSMTRRAQCDSNLKTIAMALGTHLEEHGRLPESLSVLRAQKYLPQNISMRCPVDPTTSSGYDEYYIIRAPRDSGEYPILVCPFHEQSGDHGTQAFKGRYTKQFMTKPATLVNVANTTVESPGRPPVVAYSGMMLHGGDVIKTGPQGMARVRFADNSSAALEGSSEISVLQSYVDGQLGAPLYTLISQRIGSVLHTVTPGSRYDVVTPVATAGAHGTQFLITVTDNAGPSGGRLVNGTITVTEGTVAVSTLRRTYTYKEGMLGAYPATLDPDGVHLIAAPTPTPRPTATATATPKPTATPTPRPIATATPKPTATSTPRPTATPVPTPTRTPPHDNRDGEKNPKDDDDD